MSRRHEARRLALAGLPLAGGVLAWQHAGQPEHLAGMIGACALALLAGPPLLLVIATAPGVLLQAAVPRRWRIAHRHGQHDRPPVPRRLRRAVMRADRGRCVFCGSRDKPQLDHLRPWAAGGLSSLFNFFVLCALCNRVKSNYWVADDGYVFYRPFPGCDDQQGAARIAAAERRARWNLLRYWRAAWSLA